MKKKLVLVKFRDSVVIGKWLSVEQTKKEATEQQVCLAAGWLLSVDKKDVVLALAVSPGGDEVNASLTLPVGCIVYMKTIKEYDLEKL